MEIKKSQAVTEASDSLKRNSETIGSEKVEKAGDNKSQKKSGYISPFSFASDDKVTLSDEALKKQKIEQLSQKAQNSNLQNLNQSQKRNQELIDSDQKQVQAFIKNLEKQQDISAKDLLLSMRKMKREDLEKSPQSTVEEVFKNIDLPFEKKIAAMRAYEKFIRERDSEIKAQQAAQNRKRLQAGESRDEILKEDSNRPSNRSTADLGLALLREQKSLTSN